MRPGADRRLRRVVIATAAAALAGGIVRSAGPDLGPVSLTAQDPRTIELELEDVLARSRATERIPVVIELERAAAPEPHLLPRTLRAAQHAGDLAGAYGRRLHELRASAPPEIARELDDSELLWIGGAITAQLKPEQVRAMEGRAGVRAVYYDGLTRVELSAEERARPRAMMGGWQQADDIAPGLRTIGAPAVWEAGITGEGTVVAIIDSGVDGEHPLLRHSWRGLRTDPAESWFDPWGLYPLPEDDNSTAGVGHGTMVTTIAVGRLVPGDSVVRPGGGPRAIEGELEFVTGVAPGAEWIAANAFEEFGSGTYTRRSVLLQALQWAVDPDGDPLTPNDIPDVVNNSWGFLPGRCDGLFDRAIDALERVGVPVVFAAGNRAGGFDTLAAPGNRADLLLNAFAVGAVHERSGEIMVAENSLGGPSPCSPGSIKPEVAAPGVAPVLRHSGENTATVIGNSGPFTSWAAPHASGSLALLRAANPETSPEEVKGALFSTARDLPPPGLDNRSGAGLIDVREAVGRIGGVGGVRLELVAWDWNPESRALRLEMRNRGDDGFAGGAARLSRAGEEAVLDRASAPPIAPREVGAILFTGLDLALDDTPSLRLRIETSGATLTMAVALRRATATAIELADGGVRLGLDAHGRLGRVAGGPGFEFAGGDRLVAGALLFSDGERVSDAAYVDVQGQPGLKRNPVGSDTDWSGTVVDQAAARADLAMNDARALRPTGVQIEGTAHLTSLGDTAAYAVLGVAPEFAGGGTTALAGLLLDWDFEDGDRVLWDEMLGASLMTSVAEGGPWMALTTEPRAPTTHVAVRLGNVEGGFYTVGSGLLAGPVTEEIKARLLRLGGADSSSAAISDWAQLVGVGPLRPGSRQAFLIAVGTSRASAAAALDSARAFARASGLVDPGDATATGDLRLLPPYPNPFNPAQNNFVTLPYLAERGSETAAATLDIYTVSGRRVYSERRELEPTARAEPFRWDGRLRSGELAATGVYGYVIRIGGRRDSGRFVLLK